MRPGEALAACCQHGVAVKTGAALCFAELGPAQPVHLPAAAGPLGLSTGSADGAGFSAALGITQQRVLAAIYPRLPLSNMPTAGVCLAGRGGA